MNFGLSESQQILRTNAKKFFANECPSAEVRRIMETPTAFDAKLYARHIEAAYTQMYERLQAGLPPDHIHVQL